MWWQETVEQLRSENEDLRAQNDHLNSRISVNSWNVNGPVGHTPRIGDKMREDEDERMRAGHMMRDVGSEDENRRNRMSASEGHRQKLRDTG